ncbi:hypothetical protein MOOR_26500 [Moorella thermoacetica]|uniref:Uncharacterized protein n=1 Tax=Neomoorella thermoacetica TaxID=1525 RepID=A0A1J5JQL8_NEOTH|nr:hypothetical protein MOOR_26500 [Moorella thermoacetica]
MVDGHLAADAGIHLGQEGGGHLDERNPPQPGGGYKPGDIAHHSAAQGDDGGPALDPGGQGGVVEASCHLKGFGLFSIGYQGQVGLKTGCLKALLQHGPVMSSYGSIAYHQAGGCQIKIKQDGTCHRQQSGPAVNFITSLAQVYVKLSSHAFKSSFISRATAAASLPSVSI